MAPTVPGHIQSTTILPSTFKESCNRDNFHLAGKILYDLVICAEWKKEMEQLTKSGGKKEECHKRGWGWARFFGIPPVIPESFQHLHNIQLPWQIALSREGKVVAIVQTYSIEIRNAHDDFNSVYSVCLAKDPWPRWRKACWTPDESSLVLASSTGDIDFFDLLGHCFLTIPKDTESRTVSQETAKSSWFKYRTTPQESGGKEDGAPDWRSLTAQLLFIDTQNKQWNYELLVLNYTGAIHSYFIRLSDGRYEKHFQFSLEPHCPMGATSLGYLPRHQLLVVAAPLHPALIGGSGPTSPDHMGLSLWRRLSSAPHCKLVSSLEQDMERAMKPSYLEKFPFLVFNHSNRENCIYKLSVSPSGDLLATVHTSGALGLWHIPSLRPMRIWTLDQQMAMKLVNPNLKSKLGLDYPFHINALNWWSDTELIISRNNGGITVCSIADLDNRLGLSPEWLFPTPQITEGFNGSFMVLECETKVYTRNYLGLQEASPEEADDSPPLHHRLLELTKVALFYLTDNERFQPLTERPRILHRTYRMLQLKSTTPQELFYRMLNTQRYQDALALAANHGLDADLVYQRQWRGQPVTLLTISLYLLKISKRSWALHECLERVPDNYPSTRALLLFGLSISSLEALVALGSGNPESGRLIEPDLYTPETEDEMRSVSLAEKLKSLLSYQDFRLFSHLSKDNFNPEQKQLIQTRQKLLLYLDRLATYEAILGSHVWRNFKAEFFERFRSQSWLEACLHFAHNGQWKAVQRLMVSRPLTHHLVVLSNFPESMAPHRYRDLLPRLQPLDLAVDYSIFSSLDTPVRIKDWCEEVVICDPSFPDALQDRSDDYYTQHPAYKEFKGNPSPELYTRWYRHRAAEIYNSSHLLTHATELIEIGKEFHVQGLDSIHNLLLSLECLLYECCLESIPDTLQEYEGMDPLHKMELFVSKSTEETFVKDLRRWVLPFIEREKQPYLLADFLRQLAQQQLHLCLLVFRSSQESSEPIVSKMEDLMELALECIYLSEREDQIETVFGILDCLPDRKQTENCDSEKIEGLHDRLDLLEKQLMMAEIFNQHGLQFTISHLAKCQDNTEEVKVMLKRLTRVFNMRVPPPTEQDWETLRLQLLSMQEELFTSCLTFHDCLQILVEGMLGSDRQLDILLAEDLICQTSDQQPNDDRLPFPTAREVVLSAAREYFNSAARLDDPCMALARTCLDLIQEEDDPEISEEQDLITSLELLHEFGVEILPLQVRMCQDRLTLLGQALQGRLAQKPSKALPKLLRLANLLRICHSDDHQREGLVLSLVAEASFNCQDFIGCHQTCTQIIQDGHQGGWKICYRLGMEPDFTDVEARLACLSFAAAYCSSDSLMDILKTCAHLETQVKCKKLRILVGDELASRLEDEIGIEQLKSPAHSSPKRMDRRIWKKGEKMLTSTAKSLMSSFSTPQFWKEALSWPGNSATSMEDASDNNDQLQKQGLHAFYCPPSSDKDFFCSQADPDYSHYSCPDRPQQTELYLNLLRILALKDAMDEAPCCRISSDLVQNLAQQLITQDLTLAFPLLLSVRNVQELQECFWPTLPENSVLAPQLEVYLYCVHLYSELSGESDPPVHLLSPQELFHRVKPRAAEANPDLAKLLHAAHLRLVQMTNAQFLQHQGVDVARFQQDPAYRNDTVMGMAMCEETYDSALTLADKCGVDPWEIAALQLQYHFVDANLGSNELRQKLEQSAEILSTHPAKFLELLHGQVWQSLSGTDLPRIEAFLQLENRLVSSKPDNSRLKVVQLAAQIAPGLDVKKLLEASTDGLLPLISPHLTADNLEDWENLVALLPGCSADPNVVKLLWGRRVWQKLPLPLTAKEWHARLGQLTNLLQKLAPPAWLLQFVEELLFSEFSFSHLTLETRMELLTKIIQVCRKRADNPEVLSHLEHLSRHLEAMMDPVLNPLRSDLGLASLFRSLDLSCGQEDKLQELYVQCVLDLQPLEVLQTLLSVTAASSTLDDVYLEALRHIEADLREQEETRESLIPKLEEILKQIENHSDELMVLPEMVWEIFEPVCSDPITPASTRAALLQLLRKQLSALNSEDMSKISNLWVIAAVEDSWPHLGVGEVESMMEDFGGLLTMLLSDVTTEQQLRSLPQFLELLPTPDESRDFWLQLIATALERNMDFAISTIVPEALTHLADSQAVYQLAAERGADAKSLLQVALLTDSPDLWQSALQNAKDISLDPDTDLSLVRSLADHNLLSQPDAPLFRQSVDLIVSCRDSALAASVGSLLSHYGHSSEAASLMALCQDLPAPLLSFSSVLDSFHHWLN